MSKMEDSHSIFACPICNFPGRVDSNGGLARRNPGAPASALADRPSNRGHHLEYNPFASELATLSAAHDDAVKTAAALSDQLSWYRQFDLESAHRAQQAAQRAQAQLRSELTIAQQAMVQLRKELVRHRSRTAPGFDPRYWFSSERAAARQLVARTEEQVKVAESRCARIIRDIAKNAAPALDADIARHRAFDPLGAAEQLRLMTRQIDDMQPELQRLGMRKKDLDLRLSEPARHLEMRKKERAQLRSRRERAEQFERKLMAARAAGEAVECIHAACHQALGDDSPRKVLGNIRSELASKERDIAKLQLRVNELVRWARRDVRHIVVDGNNLCNLSGKGSPQRFIGLAALHALVPVLRERYAVTLVFDAGIVRKLRTSQAAFHAMFPADLPVELMPARKAADETILNLAAASEYGCVLSGDRFVDFSGHKALDMVIAPQIFAQQVQITELNVCVNLHRALVDV